MGATAWILVGVVAGTSAVAVALVLLRWRRRATAGPDAAMQMARWAIRQNRRAQQRRRSRVNIRGKGYGGSDGQAIDAGVASDSGGAP
ncbi:hypothetical protein ACVCAH_31880 [Micromonospora sp. LZ34]